MKTEPDEWSWRQQVNSGNKGVEWSGVDGGEESSVEQSTLAWCRVSADRLHSPCGRVRAVRVVACEVHEGIKMNVNKRKSRD